MRKFSASLRKEIVRRLVAEFQPEAIYLFGSHAWGVPDANSDLDLLVIIGESQQTPTQRATRAQRSLRGLMVPVDVLVKTHTEFDRYRSVHASLEAQILDEGILLYGSKERISESLAG
jgi:predicted nucleotidyltransferase